MDRVNFCNNFVINIYNYILKMSLYLYRLQNNFLCIFLVIILIEKFIDVIK